MFARRYSFIAILFLSLTICNLAAAQDPAQPTPTESPPSQTFDNSEWPEEIRNYFKKMLSNRVDDAAVQLSNVLFDSIDDVNLLDLNPPIGNLRINTSRNIYYDRNIFETWTMVDQLSFRLSKNIVNTSIPLGNNLPSIQFALNVGTVFKFLNIRNVGRSNNASLPPLDEIKFDETQFDNLYEAESSDRKIGNIFDPMRKAQYFEPLKRLLIPLRVPYQSEGLKRLANGEIMSYEVGGSISVGPGVGWSIPVNQNTNLQLSGNYSTTVQGGFRYSIIKEDEHYARIKVTRIDGWGDAGAVGSRFDDQVLYQGFVITPAISPIGKQTLRILPFNFQAGREFIDLFDTCYRYDLTQENARHAYDLAMQGKLEYSAELAREDSERPKPSVTDVFHRISKNKGTRKNRQVSLGFLYQKADSRSINNIDAVLTFPDGTHRVLRSVAENSHFWRAVTRSRENTKYTYSFFLNLNRYEKNEEDSLSLQVEGFVDDLSSNGREMLRYSNTFEALAGVEHQVYPRVPVFPPPIERGECKGWKNITDISCLYRRLTPASSPARYGRSSFYLRLGFNRPMLEAFINTRPEEMWPILETAFGLTEGEWDTSRNRTLYYAKYLYSKLINVPLFLADAHLEKGANLDAALRFRRRWIEIQNELDATEKLKLLAELFQTIEFNHELIRILRLSVGEVAVPYTLIGTAKVFQSQIREEKWGTTVTDYLSTLSRRDLDFESYQSTTTFDDAAQATGLKIKPLSTSTPSSIVLDFDLNLKPRYLYLKFLNTNRWGLTRSVGEAITYGSLFKKGHNTLTLTHNGSSDFAKDLLKNLKVGLKYKALISISQDGVSWGPTDSTEFTFQTSAGSANAPETTTPSTAPKEEIHYEENYLDGEFFEEDGG